MNATEIIWSNQDLIPYFENVPINYFKDFAIRGGIEEGCDIDLVFPYIEETESLLEIGACYGRVLHHLIRKGYKGKLYAIERSHHFFEFLRKEYTNQVHLFNADITSSNLTLAVDAILWMWSDIASFSKKEQFPTLKRLCSWLKQDGIFILETLMHTQPSLNATNVLFDKTTSGQSYVVESEYGVLYGYIPSEEEIQEYGEALGFKEIEHVHYFTSTGRERILHIFKGRAYP